MSKLFNSLKDVKFYKNENNTIGTGGFSIVSLVYHKSNPKKLYAMKKVAKKDEKELFYINQEITLHKKLNHENIIKFYEFFQDSKYFYFFLEYAEHGDLFEFIKKHKPNKKVLKKFFYQTCLAIKYIHNKNIMHRDLKPENILINSNLQAKLCDFGWASIYKENERRESLCGTYEYMAYEVFSGDRQTKKTDIWALGILLYEFYHSYAPFRGKGIADILLKLKNVDEYLVFGNDCEKNVEDLVRMILKMDCEKRPNIEDILEHRFFDEFKDGDFVLEEKIEENNVFKRNMNFSKKKTEQVIIFDSEEVEYLIKENDFKGLQKKNFGGENHSSTRGSINDEKRDSGLRAKQRLKNKYEIKDSNFTNIYEKKKLEKKKINNFHDILNNYGDNSRKVKKYRYSYQKGNIVKNIIRDNLNYSDGKAKEINDKIFLNKIKKSNFSNYISRDNNNKFENRVEKKNYKHSYSIEPKKKIRLTFDSKLNKYSEIKEKIYDISTKKKVYSLSIKSKRTNEFMSLTTLTKKKDDKKSNFFTENFNLKNENEFENKKFVVKNKKFEFKNKNEKIDLQNKKFEFINKNLNLNVENEITNFKNRKFEFLNKKNENFIFKNSNQLLSNLKNKNQNFEIKYINKKLDFKNKLENINQINNEKFDSKNINEKFEINKIKKSEQKNTENLNFKNETEKIDSNQKNIRYHPENVLEENIYSVRSVKKNYFFPSKNYRRTNTEGDEDNNYVSHSSVKNGDKFKNRRNGLDKEISKKLRFSLRNNDKLKHNKKLKEFFENNNKKDCNNLETDNIEGKKKNLLFSKFDKKLKSKKTLKKNKNYPLKNSNSPISNVFRTKNFHEKKIKPKHILQLLKKKNYSKILKKKNLSNNKNKDISRKKKKKNFTKIKNHYTPNIKSRKPSKLNSLSKIKKNKITNKSKNNSLIKDINLNFHDKGLIYKTKNFENKKNNKFIFKNFKNGDLENIYSKKNNFDSKKNNNLRQRKNYSLVNKGTKRRSGSIRINLDHSKEKMKEILNDKKKHLYE